jgi:hypothetical protein
MKFELIIGILIILVCNDCHSQIIITKTIATPDSIREICDKLFLKEAGEEIFNACIRYDSTSGTQTDYEKGEVRLDYVLYYTFSYPTVSEATFSLTMNYSVYSGQGHLQSGRFLRFYHTDLPKTIQSTGTKLISYNEAKSRAVKANDSMAGANGIFVLGQDYFYWHFSYSYPDPDPQGDAQQYITENVVVDPYTGKILSVFTR